VDRGPKDFVNPIYFEGFFRYWEDKTIAAAAAAATSGSDDDDDDSTNEHGGEKKKLVVRRPNSERQLSHPDP
jgi:hypothetical protein